MLSAALVIAFVASAAEQQSASTRSQLDVQALAHVWPGVRDSTEQVVLTPEGEPMLWPHTTETRVRTIVSAVELPWLGEHVLYLEEFLHEEPGDLRRQLLLQLEPMESEDDSVRVRLYTFTDPKKWRDLRRSPRLLSSLRAADVEAMPGCELILNRENNQFRGGTVGRKCIDPEHDEGQYVNYQVVVGDDLYWYRRRLMSIASDELREEVVGFNWYEVNEARLFTCRIQWSPTGRDSDRRELARTDLHDQGGKTRIITPDGRRLEFALHSQDWPFAADRDALILVVQEQGATNPLASAWTELDARQIAIDLGWLAVRCGPVVPETGEVKS